MSADERCLELEIQLTEARALLAEEHAAKFVPGMHRCPKCGFECSKTLISAKTGNMAPNLEAPEPCPNDGEQMVRVTWHEHATSIAKVCEQQIERAVRAENNLLKRFGFEEADQQMVVLALAKMTFSRPGFSHALREIAASLNAEAIFDEFVKHGPDEEGPDDAREKFKTSWRRFAGKLYGIGKASGFYDHPHTDPTFNHEQKLILMIAEIIEGVEALRGAPWPGIADDKLTHRPMLEVELADTVIRVMNYASHTGLDVVGAITEKAEFNRTRGHRHGGKRF